MGSIRRGYADSRFGQLHYRSAGEATQSPALVCLHATAYSGRTFEPFMPAMAASRRVLALDTPGYGESDGPAEPASIDDYAAALGEALDAVEPGRPVDLLGYHTGAFLATELALQRPALVRRMVLIGVPFFPDAEEKALWRARLVHRRELKGRLDQFNDRWDFFVTHRATGLPIEAGFANFVDELKAFPRDWFSHHALFDYPADERLPQVVQPVLVINPTSALAAASTRAADVMPDAHVVELKELGGAIFDLGPALLAASIAGFLDS